MTNPFLFIVGCSRSGTTLLQKVVAAHPDIAIIPETRWFARWYEKQTGITDDGMVRPELVAKLLKQHRLFRDIDLGIRPEELYALVENKPGIRYADFVAYLFNRYGKTRGKPLVGNKTPGYVRRMSTLRELWPDAKYVHIYRDGRDVCLSMLKERHERPISKRAKWQRRFATIEEDPIITMALWWEWDVRLGRETGAAIGSNHYYEICYEEFVSDPEAGCRSLCTFLDVPFDDAMLQHHLADSPADEYTFKKHSRLERPITAGLRDWRGEMTSDEAARYEAAVGPLLDELGYPRTSTPVTDEVWERAARMRDEFLGRPLPQCWRPQADNLRDRVAASN